MVMASGMADKRRSRGSVLSTTGVAKSQSSSTGARTDDPLHFRSNPPSLCCPPPPPPPDNQRRHLTFKQYAIHLVNKKLSCRTRKETVRLLHNIEIRVLH